MQELYDQMQEARERQAAERTARERVEARVAAEQRRRRIAEELAAANAAAVAELQARMALEKKLLSEAQAAAEAESRATALIQARIAAEEALAAEAAQAFEAKERAREAARRRSTREADLKLIREQREKAEASLHSLSVRRRLVLLAVAGAVVLSLLLGLYLGWRQPQAPEPALQAGEAPGKLRLETQAPSR